MNFSYFRIALSQILSITLKNPIKGAKRKNRAPFQLRPWLRGTKQYDETIFRCPQKNKRIVEKVCNQIQYDVYFELNV